MILWFGLKNLSLRCRGVLWGIRGQIFLHRKFPGVFRLTLGSLCVTTPVKHNMPSMAGGYRQFMPSTTNAGVLTPDVKHNMPSMAGGYNSDYGTPIRSKTPASYLPRNLTFDGRGSWEAFG
jgi:hypothetical protein